jgi:hypothetical protein
MQRPRLIEFMMRGYDLRNAKAILAKWDTLAQVEIERLGFGSITFSQDNSNPFVSARTALQVLQGGLRSNQDTEQFIPRREPV